MIETDPVLPYPLEAAEKRDPFEEFKEVCSADNDCTEAQPHCVYLLWDFTKDGSSFGYGKTCFKTNDDICSKDSYYAQENSNYDKTDEFSYYM